MDFRLASLAQQVFGDRPIGAREARLVKCGITRHAADKLAEQKDYAAAFQSYIDAATTIIGRDLPINGPFNLTEYEQLEPGWPMADALGCLNDAADCLVKLREYKEVCYWRFVCSPQSHSW